MNDEERIDRIIGDWIERAPALCPVHTIDTEKINLRDDADAQTGLIELILDHHKEKHAKLTGAAAPNARKAGGGAQ